MNILLVPGFWLDAASWDEVVPALEHAGHQPRAITLPGMESKHAKRAKITLQDHVEAVVEAIDSCDPADGGVVLVGHSAGGPVCHAATDARPQRVAHVVYVASEPLGDGLAINDELASDDGEIPLPAWSSFGDDELVGLDDTLRKEFRQRAIPTPAKVASDPQRLTDDRRYEVSVTVIACEYSSGKLRKWVEQGHPRSQELALIHDVQYIDLPTGHWPQLTSPEKLGRLIVDSIAPA
jgi:pimeloyl-ACP methyl ester carboxylesterase